MFENLRSRIVLAAFMIVVAVILMIVVFAYIGNGKLMSDNSGEGSNYSKRIIAYTTTFNYSDKTTLPRFNYVKMQEMPSNSAVRFLNPFGKAMSGFPEALGSNAISDPNSVMTEEEKITFLKDADVFEQYILIRLPEALGGGAQNVSAFRAYSDLDPESRCMLGYRDDSGIGIVLQDPCHSDIFRVSDGYSCFGRIALGSNPVLSGYNAIPRMKLSVDSDGYLLAIRPDGQPSGDGTVGEGRIIPTEEIKSNDKVDSNCAQYIH